MWTQVETSFLNCADEFLHLLLRERGVSDIEAFLATGSRPPFPVPPVIVRDFRSLATAERAEIRRSYDELGVAHFIVGNPACESQGPHVLFDICHQLRDDLPLHHPLPHPLEGHPEAVSRFGPADGTVKIYNLPKPSGGPGYREVAETSDPFEVHLDGLGSGGTVQTVILYMDSAPLFGGITFFYDLPALGAALSVQDPEAFRALFLPDALTAIRPRGKGAIKVVSPVFYLNEFGQPHAFFRKDSGEYRMTWRSDHPPLERARQFLHEHTSPFAGGSFFVPLTRPGCAVFSRNRDMAHGRTGLIDGDQPDQRRRLSRKWFMSAAKHSVYKHVPGTAMREDIARLMPERFGGDQLVGEWLYDQTTDLNRRVT